MEQTAGVEEIDSEEEWYARMEAAAAGRDDEEDSKNGDILLEQGTESPPSAMTDEEYYNSIQDYNCNVANEAFAAESDTIWHSLMKTAVKSSAVVPPTGQLHRVQPNDSASIILAQQWAFGYLPHSSKIYMELGLYSASVDELFQMYTDDLLHPTLVAMIVIKQAVSRIEISVFSPYTTSETVFPYLFNTIEAVKMTSGLSDVVFCGADSVHYEQGLSRDARWKEQWTEVCGMYVYESHPPSEADIRIGEKYMVSDLREEDADKINNAWKYKSAASILLVKKMIASGQCCGIRLRQPKNTNSFEDTSNKREDESELVSWFLTYPDGSMGMLYTNQSHRGQGLARVAVQAVLRKVLLTHTHTQSTAADQVARRCAPYVFIEVSNEASRALFLSLGFTRRQDAIWAGLKYHSAA